jgi:hypothetical protein
MGNMQKVRFSEFSHSTLHAVNMKLEGIPDPSDIEILEAFKETYKYLSANGVYKNTKVRILNKCICVDHEHGGIIYSKLISIDNFKKVSFDRKSSIRVREYEGRKNTGTDI